MTHQLSRRSLLKSALLFSAFGVAGCDGAVALYVRRFLYKIVIGYDGREYVGSSVYEIRVAPALNLLPFPGTGRYAPFMKGQAPFVVIPGVGTVFALLIPPEITAGFNASNTALALAKYVPKEIRQKSADDFFDYAMNLQGEHEIGLEENGKPVVVLFSNPRNFESVQRVPSGGVSVAGKDLFLLKATLALTDDPVTHKITSSVLPAFDGHALRPIDSYETNIPIGEKPFGARIFTECFNYGDRPPDHKFERWLQTFKEAFLQ